MGRSETLAVARAASEDPDILAEFLGFDQANLHREIQHHLNRDDATAGVSRGHGKSVQVGIREAFEIGRNPEIRIKHVGQTEKEIRKQAVFLIQIMRSPAYRLAFPHIKIKSPRGEDEGALEITVKHSGLHRDPTFQAVSIFGRASGRADLLVGDDVCDFRNTILQPADRPKVIEAWRNNWLPMLDPSAGKSRIWRFFTPYHEQDLTMIWKKVAGENGSLLWRPCNGLVSPWAEAFTPEVLAARRQEQGELAYARAYELRPIDEGSLIFKPQYLEAAYYTGDPSTFAKNTGRIIASIDWAYTKAGKKKADHSVCVIALVDGAGFVWVLEIIRVQETFPEFKRRAIAACGRLRVTRILAEANGTQLGIFQQFQEDTSIPCQAVERDGKDKITRAVEEQAMIEQGRLKLRTRPSGILEDDHQMIRDELVGFPADHDDIVDPVVDLLRFARTNRYSIGAKPSVARSKLPKLYRLYGK